MKHIICRFTYSTAVMITAVLFCMAVILASPSISKAGSGTIGAKPMVSEVDRIDARIKEFHSKLKITEAQEEQWNKLALVMKENATTMHALVQERKEKVNTLNAVEDLKSYGKIADAHAAGLNKFIPIFEVLYSHMSDDQKKTADKLFTKRINIKMKKK